MLKHVNNHVFEKSEYIKEFVRVYIKKMKNK